MPATGHVHHMEAIAWTTPRSGMGPVVLLGCTTGVCAQTESFHPNKLSRKVPNGLTQGQFDALKDGKYWTQIADPSSPNPKD